jgi:hypothetical protein
MPDLLTYIYIPVIPFFYIAELSVLGSSQINRESHQGNLDHLAGNQASLHKSELNLFARSLFIRSP